MSAFTQVSVRGQQTDAQSTGDEITVEVRSDVGTPTRDQSKQELGPGCGSEQRQY